MIIIDNYEKQLNNFFFITIFEEIKTNEYKNYLLIQHNEDTYISLDNNHDKVLTDLLIELINSFDLRGNKSHSEQLKILNNCIDCIDNFDYYFNDRNDRISELLTFMFVIFN